MGLESEAELWTVLKSRQPAPRGTSATAPAELQMPASLFEALVLTFGLDEDEVRALNEPDALARYVELCEGPGGEKSA